MLTKSIRLTEEEAAEVAGVPRAEFLQLLMEKGITLLEGPSTLAMELEVLAERLGNERLGSVASRMARARD